MALVSVCASAQVYIGGTAGISSNKIGDGDSKTAYTLMPEIGYQFNNKWEAGLEIGIKKGEVCKLSPVGESTTFRVAPYVRYTAVETKLAIALAVVNSPIESKPVSAPSLLYINVLLSRIAP